MNKITKKILLLTPLFLIFLAIVMIAFPETWFRSPVVSFILPKILHQVGFNLKVSELNASAQRLNWKTIRFDLSWKESELSSANLKADVRELGASVEVKWFALPPRLSQVSRLQINAPRIEVTSSDSPHQEKKGNQAWIALPEIDWIKTNLKLGTVDISAPSVSVASDSKEKPILIDAEISTRLNSDGQHSLEISIDEKNKNQGKVYLSLPLDTSGSPIWMKTQAHGALSISGVGKITARFSPLSCASNELCLQGATRLDPLDDKYPGINADFIFSMQSNKWALTMTAAASPISSMITSISTLSNCMLELDDPLSSQPKANINCDLLAQLRISDEKFKQMPKLPTQATIQIRGSASSQERGKVAHYQGDLNVDSSIRLDPFFSMSLSSHSLFNGELSGAGNNFHHETRLSGQAELSQSQASKALFHDTSWAIPAPFNNMNGTVNLTLQTLWKDWQTQIPFELSTHLSSAEQSLQTQAHRSVEIRLKPTLRAKVSADWELNNVRLSFPRFDPKSLPRFLADKDIKNHPSNGPSNGNEEREPSALSYSLRINSPRGHPVQIDSDLLKTPLHMDLHATIESEKTPDFNLSILPIEFEVFRRKGNLEKLEYAISTEKKDGWVKGHIEVPSGEYQVGIHFQGTTDKIRVHLSSKPPMPEDQLWAVLLFGEPMQEITPDQQSSTEATSRAFSEGATDLVSFFLFSNTPVERVNYDPATNAISVAFHGPAGTTLKIGHSDLTNGDIGLRKPIGKGWALDADVQKPTNDESAPQNTSLGAGIEWSTRY